MSVLFATNIADPHHWTINTCFGAFCNVRVHLVPYRYRTKLGAKRAELEQSCEDSCHEVASEFLIMNAPDPCHRTPNSCFTAFSTVWLYLGLFLYCPKQGAKGAKLVQLMQNFVPHRNFSQQSQLIWTIWPETQIFVHFVMLGCIWDRFITARNSVQQINVKVHATKSPRFFYNKLAWSTPLDPKLMFWCLS